jgi:uncharacterized protein
MACCHDSHNAPAYRGVRWRGVRGDFATLNRILAGLIRASRWRADAFGRVRDLAGRDAGAASAVLVTQRLAQGLVVLLALAHAPAALAAPTSLGLSGGVVDEAGILPADAIASIAVKLKTLEDRTGDDLVVATVKSLLGDNIDDYADQLGRAWGVGGTNKNKVVILLVAPNERKVRIEVSGGLVVSLTDAVSQSIIDNVILPRFRANDLTGGIETGVDAIIKVLDGDGKEVPTPK